MTFDHLRVEKDGHTAVVFLNRPKRMNAINAGMMQEIIQVAHEFYEDRQVRVVIFTGTGKHFSCGSDLRDKDRL